MLYNAYLLLLVMSMEMRLCSEAKALFVEVCSFDDSTELCVTAVLREGEKNAHLDFSFFIEILDDDLNFTVFDDGSWNVEYVYASEEKSWLPNVPRVSDTLVFSGVSCKLVNLN